MLLAAVGLAATIAIASSTAAQARLGVSILMPTSGDSGAHITQLDLRNDR